MIRGCALLMIVMSLSGCSYDYPVQAVFIDGRVAFVQRDDEKTSSPWCMNSFKVANVDGTPMWEFDTYEAYRTARTCGPFFPMFYGDAPTGAKIVTAPRQLVPGQTYVISGYARESLSGVFQYNEMKQRKLITFGRDSNEAIAAYERYWLTQRRD